MCGAAPLGFLCGAKRAIFPGLKPKPAYNQSMKKYQIGAIIFAILCVGYAIGYASGASDTRRNLSPTPAKIGANLIQDPVLLADASQLGLNPSDLNMSFVSTVGSGDVKEIDSSNVYGSFSAPNNIVVRSGLDKKTELASLAHEFMHYSWNNLPLQERQSLTKTYQNYYDNNTSFRAITAGYVGSPDAIATERNSVACTGVNPSTLDNDFNAYCNKFIPNRAILFQ